MDGIMHTEHSVGGLVLSRRSIHAHFCRPAGVWHGELVRGGRVEKEKE